MFGTFCHCHTIIGRYCDQFRQCPLFTSIHHIFRSVPSISWPRKINCLVMIFFCETNVNRFQQYIFRIMWTQINIINVTNKSGYRQPFEKEKPDHYLDSDLKFLISSRNPMNQPFADERLQKSRASKQVKNNELKILCRMNGSIVLQVNEEEENWQAYKHKVQTTYLWNDEASKPKWCFVREKYAHKKLDDNKHKRQEICLETTIDCCGLFRWACNNWNV